MAVADLRVSVVSWERIPVCVSLMTAQRVGVFILDSGVRASVFIGSD